jgi:hypothetical protein
MGTCIYNIYIYMYTYIYMHTYPSIYMHIFMYNYIYMNTFIGTAMKGQRRSKEAKWVGQKGDLKPKTKAPFLEPDLYDYEGKHFVNVCTIMKMKKRLLENLDLQYMHTYLYIHICMSMSEYEHV